MPMNIYDAVLKSLRPCDIGGCIKRVSIDRFQAGSSIRSAKRSRSMSRGYSFVGNESGELVQSSTLFSGITPHLQGLVGLMIGTGR